MRELLPHQKPVIDKMSKYKRFALYASPGTGKTTMSLYDWYWNSSAPVLIVVTKSSLVNQWVNEGIPEMEFPKSSDEIIVTALNKGSKKASESVSAALESIDKHNKLHIFVVSYSSVWRIKELLSFNKLDVGVIFDESHFAKNRTSKQSKFCVELSKKYSWIRLLTGTPMSIGWEDYMIPLKLLQEDDIKVKTIKAFKENFMIVEMKSNFSNRSTYESVVGYKNLDTLKEIINRKALFLDEKKAGIELPEQIEKTYYVEQSKEAKKALVDRTYGNWILKNSGSKMMAHRTSSSGFLYGEGMHGERIVEQFKDQNKKDMFKDIIDGVNGKVLVFHNFEQEREDIADAAKELGKTVSYITKDGADVSGDIIISHYTTGSTGLNLQMLNHILYYSPTIVGSDFIQSKKRIHRIGQNETCYYYYLITKGTIEEKILSKTKLNQDYTNEMFEEEYDI